MNTSLETTLGFLEALIRFDTRNGTGDEPACVDWLAERLGTFNPDKLIVDRVSRSRGKSDSAYVLAIWGQPDLILNVHIDTVPSGEGWLADPLIMRRGDDRVTGLGACDIKGAAACILSALSRGEAKNLAVLFSGDEEQGSEIMPAIISAGHLNAVKAAIVCEPTGGKVGKRHRGMLAVQADFHGPGGHSSLADEIDAPLLKAARLASKIGEYGEANRTVGVDPFKGLCTNIGDIKSDGAYNVIPTSASLWVSMRPPPGVKVQTIESAIYDMAQGMDAELDTLVAFEAFETLDVDYFKGFFQGIDFIDLPYWTEAAMMSEFGINTVVFGPGYIEQAHKPEEWVSLEQLEKATQFFETVIGSEREQRRAL
ncbi:N-acetylcitrulline deacetylase [Litorimonas taeanensis]|uniref:N-acetylcitrulline deacetylase n=1 Tax=Litorimonas taeanensis TaxID=568099 RepID=A0A420WKY2_9PROT|nr:M20/M25/M40 family metallo-hydrolase [Litorimonas taeanensis]RKQ71683.1 N-acetylcitrulline deacetylase [Litorimonas taeanensis]